MPQSVPTADERQPRPIRFSMKQLLIAVTGVCVLCAVLARMPESRGILEAFVLGSGLSFLAAIRRDHRTGRWLYATLGAWIVLGLFAFPEKPSSSQLTFSEIMEVAGASGLLACLIGTVAATAVGGR